MIQNSILIVEDEEVVAADLQSRLARMGYETPAPVPSGEAAVETARDLRPALVLMDITLSGAMDGIQAAAAIRQELNIPVVFITAHSDAGTLDRARLAEPHAYIVKPFDDANLRAALKLVPYRHALERRLETINRWFAAARLHVGDAVIATNHRGEIVFMNPLAEKLTGWSLQEAAGRPCVDVVTLLQAGTGVRLHDPADIALREGVVMHLTDETLLVSRDGTRMHVDNCATPVQDEAGHVTGAVVVITETSSRQEAAGRIAQLNERVRTLSEQASVQLAEKEHFEAMIAAVSHDLRAPLRTIIGFTDLLSENTVGNLDADGRRFLDTIRLSSQRLSAMFDDYLAFLKASRQETLATGLIDMTALVKSAFSEVSAQQSYSASAIFTCGTLPAAVGARGLIRQVMANLLGNALKYSSRSNKPVIEVGARREGLENVYWVKDNGAGFNPNCRDRLFRPFHRLHHEHEFPGTGIGLAIVKKIIEKHRGRVWAEGEIGRGATFFFSLPTVEPIKP